MNEAAKQAFISRGRWHPAELLPWAIALAAIFVLPDYMALGTQILIAVLFALSLDLVLGYAGIVTLGHAAFFGAGAYAAGMLSAHLGWNEPLSGLIVAAAAAGLLGIVSGLVLLRYHGLTLLMLTLATAVLLQEFANVGEDWTGGFDGLIGITIDPLFGVLQFDLWGNTSYRYALGVLLICFLLVRRIVNAPFGLTLTGIRENRRRMEAAGTPVYRRLVTAYAISAALAGVAGGLFAQTNAYVTLDVLSFARSGAVLIMLILGGTGRCLAAIVVLVQRHSAIRLAETFNPCLHPHVRQR